ncbi:phage baseplate protein [Photorhabdus sp. RM323S]|uniref:phage baseplate protein n=1 Tax=Photorhabdus sp. RM323S TaxID=3342828 RepID=UPI0036D8435A
MDILSAIFQQQTRKFGTESMLLVPSVVISEKHTDALEITEHPVEIGAAVSDHAYKKPSEITMELGFAGGGSLLDFVDTSKIGLSMGLSPKETYQKILDLQELREPFKVITGKRTYENMLIKAIEVTTDRLSENVLLCTLTLREVIITSTQKVQVAEKEVMKTGVSTSAVENSGTKAPQPVNESVLSEIKEGAVNAFRSYIKGGG